MGVRRAKSRLFAVAAAMALPAPAMAQPAATPPAIWRDLAHIRILCLVVTEHGVDSGPLRARVCERARAIAAVGAPAPVAVAETVDPAVLAPDSLTLLVHVRIEPAAGGRVAALSVRPFRNDGSAMLFAAAPRAALLSGPQDAADALERPLSAALAETLPWLAPPAPPRPVHP